MSTHTLIRAIPTNTLCPPAAALPPPLPPGVVREFIPGPAGQLELQYAGSRVAAAVADTASSKPPLLLLHGGFGSAACYSNYLPALASADYHSYALSLRGHGASHNPGYWRLYFTSVSTFASDAAAALRHIRKLHPNLPPPVLVGHSAGGGLAQFIAAHRLAPLSAIALLAAIPGSGSFWVNFNWWCLDPWFFLRFLLCDWGHPRSPLGSTKLVRQAFFGRNVDNDNDDQRTVVELEAGMSEWESMAWSMGMMWRFVPSARAVLDGLRGFRSGGGVMHGRKIVVIAGEDDKLVSPGICKQLVNWYETAKPGRGDLMSDDAVIDENESDRIERLITTRCDIGSGLVAPPPPPEFKVRYRELPALGHHFMRDVGWEYGVTVLLRWLNGEKEIRE